jgi:hypothetical protein
MACRFGPRHSNFRGEKALATFFALGERLARRLPTRVELGLFVTSRIPLEVLTKDSHFFITVLTLERQTSARRIRRSGFPGLARLPSRTPRL